MLIQHNQQILEIFSR